MGRLVADTYRSLAPTRINVIYLFDKSKKCLSTYLGIGDLSAVICLFGYKYVPYILIFLQLYIVK